MRLGRPIGAPQRLIVRSPLMTATFHGARNPSDAFHGWLISDHSSGLFGLLRPHCFSNLPGTAVSRIRGTRRIREDQEDTTAGEFEYRGTLEDTGGYWRSHQRAGSGP